MSGAIKGLFICNQSRNQELNNRLYNRNTTSAPVNMQYSIRGTPTRYVHMPILGCNKQPTVKNTIHPNYNVNSMFTPSSSLPFNGYQDNIDVETKLRGTIFPLQSCPQAKYIPSSKGDLYNNSYLTATNNPVAMTNNLLFNEEKFKEFDPNTCNLGYQLFDNHTRVQLRDM